MKLLRLGLLAGAGALAYKALRGRSIAPRFEFLDPHTAGFTSIGGSRFNVRNRGTHSSAASAANDGGYRDDRDVVGSGIQTPGSELPKTEGS
jgi:hypothetical protein